MPDANGRYYFPDYATDLQNRGFDGFALADLKFFVNQSYFDLARRCRTFWEMTTDTFTIAAGAATVTLGTELPRFRSLVKLYVTTVGYEKKLRPMSDEDFFNTWLARDLTSITYRGEPDKYKIWQNKIYVLAPPASSRDFLAHYRQRVVNMSGNTDLPITPEHLDEAILLGARIRAHSRANEPSLAQILQGDLEAMYDDIRDDEEQLMEEEPTRTLPDRSWL